MCARAYGHDDDGGVDELADDHTFRHEDTGVCGSTHQHLLWHRTLLELHKFSTPSEIENFHFYLLSARETVYFMIDSNWIFRLFGFYIFDIGFWKCFVLFMVFFFFDNCQIDETSNEWEYIESYCRERENVDMKKGKNARTLVTPMGSGLKINSNDNYIFGDRCYFRSDFAKHFFSRFLSLPCGCAGWIVWPLDSILICSRSKRILNAPNFCLWFIGTRTHTHGCIKWRWERTKIRFRSIWVCWDFETN